MQPDLPLIKKPAYSNEWIWSRWLKAQHPPHIRYKRFKHIEFVEDETIRPDIESALAGLLYTYHTHLPIYTNLLAHLGYPQLAHTLNSSFDQRPRSSNTRTQSGNFIEILACELAKKQGYDIPVLRLQYNPNRDQSMKGDDILGFQFIDNGSSKNIVLVGEGKFRGNFTTEAVIEAYDGLKDKVHSGPISMEFIAAILSRENNKSKAAKVIQLRKLLIQGDKKVTQKYLLFLGTVGQQPPRDPFKYLEDFDGELLSNLVAVNIVFKTGLQSWLDQVYNQEYGF